MNFNWWIVTGVIEFVFALWMAVNQYKKQKMPWGWRVSKKFSDGNYFIFGGVVVIVMTVQLMIESHAGIIQLLDSCWNGIEDPVWSVLMCPFVAFGIALVFGMFLAISGIITSRVIRLSMVKKIKRRYRRVAI